MREPGIYDDIPPEEYHKAAGLSKSGMVEFALSPRHYITPETITQEKQRLFDVGQATHTLILEPELETETVMVLPRGVNKTHKVGKRLAEEAKESGRVLLTSAQHDQIIGMRLSVWEHPKCRQILEGCVCEQSLFWDHPDYGFRCKARWDFHKEGKASRLVGDLKTTGDARPYKFQKVYADLKYYWQGEWYLSSGDAVLGPKEHEVFVFIVVEREPPHGVMVYEMSVEDRLAAIEEMTPLLASYAECLETREWPCYQQHTEIISLPTWAQKRIFN